MQVIIKEQIWTVEKAVLLNKHLGDRVMNFRLEESNQQKRKNIDELNRKLSAEKEKQLQNV